MYFIKLSSSGFNTSLLENDQCRVKTFYTDNVITHWQSQTTWKWALKQGGTFGCTLIWQEAQNVVLSFNSLLMQICTFFYMHLENLMANFRSIYMLKILFLQINIKQKLIFCAWSCGKLSRFWSGYRTFVSPNWNHIYSQSLPTRCFRFYISRHYSFLQIKHSYSVITLALNGTLDMRFSCILLVFKCLHSYPYFTF